MHDKNTGNYVMLHLFTQNITKMKADKRYQYMYPLRSYQVFRYHILSAISLTS